METISPALLTFLLNSVWQIPLVTAVAWLISKALSNNPPRYRHAVWIAALIAALILPLASVGTVGKQLSKLDLIPFPSQLTFGASSVRAGTSAARPSSSLAPQKSLAVERSTTKLLVVAYLLFLLFQLARFGRAFTRTAQIRRHSHAVRQLPALVESVWTRAAAALCVKGVELRVSASVPGPLMVGGWRRTIILPECLLGEQCEDMLMTAIGHEMAHIARHDFALNLLCGLLRLPLAFHPAVAVIRRGIDATRELACDDLVTRQLMDRRAYARSIVSIAHVMTGLPRPGYTLGVFDGDILEERIENLTLRPRATLKRARLLFASGLSALAVCAAIASGLAISARAQSAALPEMKLAEAAYNGGDFNGAVSHFQSAVNLDPNNVNARLFLAAAIVRMVQVQQSGQIIRAGAEGPYLPAIQQYDEILARDPINAAAVLGLAKYGGSDRLQQTHDLLMRVIESDPKNKEAYYTAGVVDWMLVFKPIQQAFAVAGVPPISQLPDSRERKSLRDQYESRIEEGLRMLQLASDLDPNWADPIAYLNLLYRCQAVIADTSQDFKESMAKGDALVARAIGLQRASAGQQSKTPPLLNVEGPPPSKPLMQLPAPPPPPPGIQLRRSGEPKQ